MNPQEIPEKKDTTEKDRQIFQMQKQGFESIAKGIKEVAEASRTDFSIEGAEVITYTGPQGPEGKPGKTPEKYKDYFTESERDGFVSEIMSRIRIPKDGKDGRDGKDAKVDYDSIRKFVSAEAKKIPRPKDGKNAVIDYELVTKYVLMKMPKQVPAEVDYARIHRFCLEEIEKIEISRASRVAMLHSGGPTTRLGEISDVNLTGLQINNTIQWNGSAWVPGSAGGGSVTSVTGTANRITIGGTAAAPTVDISTSYVGQATITTLGTITTGTWTGTAIAAANGGTGQAGGYNVGDILYASGASALSKLNDVATGNALISGGLNTAPSWGKIGLTTHVSGTLGVGNGGTGTATTFTAGSVIFAGSSGIYSQDNANFFFDDTNNYLGLGTTTPGNTNAGGLTLNANSRGLEVKTASAAGYPFFYLRRSDNATGLDFIVDSASTGTAFIDSRYDTAGASLVIRSRTAGTAVNSVTISGNGRVCIGGNTSPSARLTIDSSTGATETGDLFTVINSAGNTAFTLDNGTLKARFYAGGGTTHAACGYRGAVGIGIASNADTASLCLIVNSLDKAYVDNSGNFGVGTSNTQSARMHAIATTEQLRLGYDVSNYFSTTVSSAGLVTFNAVGASSAFTFSDAVNFTGKMTTYNNVTTAGNGIVSIVAQGVSNAQTAAVASVAAYTVGAADSSFEVSANVLVTTSTTHNFTVTCAYTDTGNTARTLTLFFTFLAGSGVTAIVNANGAVPYQGLVSHIRCKAGTTITIASTGTFTTVTYNIEGVIRQLS